MGGRLVCVSVKMPRGMRLQLERVSKSLGMPMSKIMRLAVNQALSDGIENISLYAYEADEYVITTFKVPPDTRAELKRMARANMVSASEIVRLALMRLLRTLTPHEVNYVRVYESVPAPMEVSIANTVVLAQGVVP